MRLSRKDVFVPAPSVTAAVGLSHWAAALREWVSQVPLNPAPHPFGRVFGQEFDETQLLQLCRDGPVPGERGLGTSS